MSANLERPASFLDRNSGAALLPQVKDALLSLLSSSDLAGGLIPNPSSSHAHGRQSRKILDRARTRISLSLGVDASRVVLTSSGTESNQLAIRSALEPLLVQGARPHWILSRVEHDSVRRMVPWLEARGGSISWIDVDSQGRVDPSRLDSLIRAETALVSLIWVQNETGVLSPVVECVNRARALGVAVHIDGAQAWGKLAASDFQGLVGAEYVAFSGSKIGALPGSGVVVLPLDRPVASTVLGSQESERRGGTVALLSAHALGAAAEAVQTPQRAALWHWQRNFEARLKSQYPEASINGAQAERVPGTISVSFDGVGQLDLVAGLDLAGFSVSAGSACSSGTRQPSQTLLAMGHSEEAAFSTIRVSVDEPLGADVEESFFMALDRLLARGRRRGLATATHESSVKTGAILL